MSEPKIQIVQIGETVQFDCNARPTADVQGKLFMVLFSLVYALIISTDYKACLNNYQFIESRNQMKFYLEV